MVAGLGHAAGAGRGTVTRGEHDVDDNQDVALKYGIMGIPALLLFENGEVVQKLSGVQPKPKLQEMLDEAKG